MDSRATGANRRAPTSLLLLTAALLGASLTACEQGGGTPRVELTTPSWLHAAWADNPREQSNHLADISERAIASVVNISTRSEGPSWQQQGYGPYLNPFDMTPRQREGVGSGVIVSTDGTVLTNHHVIEGADSIEVRLSDGRTFAATVVGSDPPTDLAVLRLTDAENLPAMAFGDSASARPGEMVLAVGNPFGLSGTVTMGIVSAIGRQNMGITDFEDFIQTDAAINPGNSGGALINLDGELIGINTAILSRTGGSAGVGFAIPSAMARSVMESLVRDGRVIRGYLGVSIADLTPEIAAEVGAQVDEGAVVASVTVGSPGARGGLLVGDVIVEIEGEATPTAQALRTRVAELPVGEAVAVRVDRAGELTDLQIELGERPSPGRRAAAGQVPGKP